LRVVEFPPVDDAKLASMDPNFMMKVVGPTAPARGVAPTNPLEHRTRTVDYAIIMSGEIDMMLDDKTVHLKAGDVAVQQATNHAWLNHGKEPCRVIFVLMDSKESVGHTGFRDLRRGRKRRVGIAPAVRVARGQNRSRAMPTQNQWRRRFCPPYN
jgi:mannose-6-phosphate isomerase-like protein (cupin superfamily)